MRVAVRVAIPLALVVRGGAFSTTVVEDDVVEPDTLLGFRKFGSKKCPTQFPACGDDSACACMNEYTRGNLVTRSGCLDGQCATQYQDRMGEWHFYDEIWCAAAANGWTGDGWAMDKRGRAGGRPAGPAPTAAL